MAFDLSWLWTTLTSIVDAITSWFSGISGTLTSITNTGQGIFAGLLGLGSQLWDAILKGIDALGNWLYKTFKWFYDGLLAFASTFGSWVNLAFSWIGSAVSWLAMQVYNVGQWLYNSAVYVFNWIVNTLIGIWNAIIGWFSGVASAIGSWWGSIINAINTWFTNLMKMIRSKMMSMIMADVTIAGVWKAGERILSAHDLTDVLFGGIGMAVSPIIGWVVGLMVDAVVPTPTTGVYPLIPVIEPFAYTPPPISVTTPTEKTPPSIGAPLTPIGWFTGVMEISLPVSTTYDVTWVTPTQKTVTIGLSYETVIA